MNFKQFRKYNKGFHKAYQICVVEKDGGAALHLTRWRPFRSKWFRRGARTGIEAWQERDAIRRIDLQKMIDGNPHAENTTD